MENPIPVTIPLLNPNEPEAMITALYVDEGQRVSTGDLLCTLETTKSASDVEAESAGFVIGLRFEQGDVARAGEVLCYIANSPDWSPPESLPEAEAKGPADKAPAGLRITKPALALAFKLGIDLDELPKGPLLTESAIRERQEQTGARSGFARVEEKFDPTAIVVYGAGGHGKMAIDLLRALGSFRIAGILDDGVDPGTSVMGVPVLGGREMLEELHANGIRLALNAVGGIGNIAVRVKIFEQLSQAGFACPAVIHPSAYVEPSAHLSPGVQVFAHAYVGSEAQIGYGAIINTGAIVSHDCQFGDYVNVSPGAMLAGEVRLGSGALVGMGATVNLQVSVGAGARIGNGATVKADVPEKGIVRAGTIWPE